ncbi:hypothetical protein GCM10010513_32770 [Streptomyces glebosus]|nr:hypothetical protein GCM10010513_32770 [Streptomyces glebosus]
MLVSMAPKYLTRLPLHRYAIMLRVPPQQDPAVNGLRPVAGSFGLGQLLPERLALRAAHSDLPSGPYCCRRA